MILGIDPKVDYAFKYLLGRDSTRAILIHMLNTVLDLPAGRRIEEIELLNPFNLQETLDDKLSVLDIKARDQSGRQFNIEMQMLGFPNYLKRALYYWAKLYQQQLHEGDEYTALRPTISITFLNDVLFPQTPAHHLRFHLREDDHHIAMIEDIEFHFLELPKFTKTLAELKSGLDIWLYFLRFEEKIDTEALPAVLQHPAIQRAIEELKMLTQSDMERERYEARRKAQHDYTSAIASAREQGVKIGEERGVKIGEERGVKIGEIAHARKQLLRLGQAKLGLPDPASLAAVNALVDVYRLDALCERLLAVNSWSDLLRE